MTKFFHVLTIITFIFISINAYKYNKQGLNVFDELANNEDTVSLMESIINGFFYMDSLLNISNLTQQHEEDSNKCFNSLVNSNISELYSWVKSQSLRAFDACGKYLGDFGFSDDCEFSSNPLLEFFLLNYTLKISDFNTTQQYQVMKFMDQQNFYTGICMFTNCMNIIEIAFKSEALTGYLETVAGIKKLTLITKAPKDKNNFNSQSIAFIIISIIFYFIILSMLIICIIRLSCFFSFRWKYLQFLKQNETEDDQSQTESTISEDTNTNALIKPKSNVNVNNTTGNDILNRSKRIFEEELNRKNSFRNNFRERCGTFIAKYGPAVDPFQNFYSLVTRKNYWFNDMNLEFVAFLRSCVNLGLSLFYNFLIIRQIPPKDLFNKLFYTQPHLYVIKLSSYSYVIWVMLDGIVMSFKLFNMIKDYFKTNCDKTITPMFMLKYFSLIIPKLITFIIVYLYFYIYALNSELQSFPSVFLFCRNLLSRYWQTIIKPGPLYFSGNTTHSNIMFPYIDFKNTLLNNVCSDSNSINSYSNGSDIVFISWPIKIVLVAQIMVNEFYCFIIYLIILYIAFAIRKPLYDKIIQVIIISLAIILPFCFTSSHLPAKDPCYIYFIGNMKHDYHFCFTLYYYGLGVILGMCFFYYQDIKNNFSSIQNGSYIPFDICKVIVKKIYLFSKKRGCFVKCVILGVLVLMMFVGVTTPAFCYMKNGIKEINDSACSSLYLNVFYNWEKVFISILFTIVFLLMIAFIRGSVLEYLFQPNFTLFIERIGSIMFLFLPWFVVFAYSKFMFQYSLSFQNLLFISIGLNMFAVIICVCFYLLSEIFFRKILKYKIIRSITWEKFHKERAVIEDELSINETDSLHND